MRRDRLVGKRRAARAGTLSLALSLALVAVWASPPAGAADLGGTIPSGTSVVDNFNTDLFTGAATAQIPIEVPAGAAGVAPKIALLYNSATVDELKITEPGQSTGLGWSLDIGGFIVRGNPGYKLVFGGVTHNLVLVNSAQRIFHTKDETWIKAQHVTAGDYWVVTTKDGTTHRFGFNRDAKNVGWITTSQSVVYRYSLDEVTTTSGVAVRYAYTQIRGSIPSTGQQYDRAQYIDTITYAHRAGAAVGPLRQVKFTWGDRTDWTPLPIQPIDDMKRLERVDVTLGGAAVRSYSLTYDYSIDRAPGHTYAAGATGDLTLRSVRVTGADGTSTLPPVSFDYANARLSGVTNGIGGTVSYVYQRYQSRGLYNFCIRPLFDEYGQPAGCGDWATTTTYPTGQSIGGAHIKGPLETEGGWVPLYRACLRPFRDDVGAVIGCADFGPSRAPDAWGYSSVQGEARATTDVGLIPVYRACAWPNFDEYGVPIACSDYIADTNADPWGLSVALGYVYAAPVDRRRVVDRTVSDGRGGGTGTDYQYAGLRVKSGEFRGHGAVRVIDNLGHYADSWFKQDDDFRGRPYQTETRTGPGVLLARTVNTLTKTNPFAGVTFAVISSTRATICDDTGGACRDTEQTFAYDITTGNPTRTRTVGDPAATGDEREEVTDWVVNPTTWLHRPTRVVLLDAAGATVRERWVSYDGLAWGTLGARGIVTQEERRLAGGRGTSGNPIVTHAYDVHGNRTSTTDPRNCATTTVYGGSQVYPTSVRTCLGHVTTFVHDERWGVRTLVTDPNGQPTASVYDAFGRVTRVRGPLDTGSLHGTVSHFYLDFGNPSLQRVVTYRTERHGAADYIWSEEYFDGLTRIWQTRAEGPDLKVIEAQTLFDSRGLVARKSAPRFSGTAAVWTVFSHDPRGRVVQVLSPDGTTVRTAYAPDRVTVTDARGNVRRKISDHYGRMVRAEEINGAQTYVTRYTHDAADLLVRVTNHLGHVSQTSYDALGRKTQVQDPNMGTWTYTYDLAGNLIGQRDAKLQMLTFTYDLQGRPLTKRYPNGAEITWKYDDPAVPYSRGRVTRIDDLATSTSYTYDRLGRTIQTRRLLDGTTYVLGQAYDALGRVTSQTFPDNEVVTFTYNTAGWLSSVPGYVNRIRYNARGQRTSVEYPNFTTSNFEYHDTSFRITRRSTVGVSGPLQPAGLIQSLRYTYDPNGNITRITDDVATAGRSFTYDPLNRLVSASGTFGPPAAGLPSAVSQAYRYDAIGNMLENAGQLYTYSDPSHPSAATTGPGGATYTYDANGNTLTGSGRTSAWDPDNRLAASTVQGGASVQYAYDHGGIRVWKAVGSSVTRYPFGGYEIDAAMTITKHIKLGEETLATRKSSGARLFHHADHLGGVNYVTDANGYRVQLTEYTPWGVVSRNDGTAEPSKRFTGKEFDPETGLLYYGGRYYDAKLARFITPDPFVAAPGNPQSLNRYAYVLNNPVNLVDPSGFFWKRIGKFFEDFWKVKLGIGRHVIPVVAGIIVGVVVTYATSGCVPCGAAAGGATAGALSGALNTIYYGGGAGEVFQNAAIGGAIGGVAGAIGAYAGLAAAQLASSGFVGAVVGGTLGGGAGGAMSAAIHGGNVGTSALYGAVYGAISAAVAYGGYQAYQAWRAGGTAGPSYADAGACDVCGSDERAMVRPFARRLSRMPIFDHKGYVAITSDGVTYYEMGPVDGRITILESHGDYGNLSQATIDAFRNDGIVWGGWSTVNRSALTTAQSLYNGRWVGHTYNPLYHNSNYYVNSVLGRAGANPVVPFTIAPGFP